ncbi:hypothetical protein HMPREF1991_02810 [Hoylesella loescheii DSM 19665 = JCM 12249 = ATCC 15930]|uniref:Uncharacterized protein n=1 Tax=Hoylesella loescheii DSM 19665 = JCM 12249 = ATCC 15930 TaxID=1122985 RepID=A0A069QDY5_HOYLO|nr:hypothetical protein HMPREF1991_02810 [Hoylesella loescheii DSM 19665 = JCM 12249 = ATCC 15930]
MFSNSNCLIAYRHACKRHTSTWNCPPINNPTTHHITTQQHTIIYRARVRVKVKD